MTQPTIVLLFFFLTLLCIFIVAIIFLIYAQVKEKKARKIVSLEGMQRGYLLIYASQSGLTKDYAKKTAEQLEKIGEAVVLLNISQLQQAHLEQAKTVLWMASTYGEGDSPDSAQEFQHLLLSQQFDLSHQSFAILAFGDRRYTQFCAFGQHIYDWLTQQNAQPLFDLVTVDQLSKDDLSHWNDQLAKYLSLPLNIELSVKNWESIHLFSRKLLNEGSLGTGLYQLVFDIPQHMVWNSGDILEIQCRNSNDALQEFQKAHSDVSHEHLSLLLSKNLRNIPDRLRQQSVEKWIESFLNLPIREYSIASIPQQGHLKLVVRQEVLVSELGLGSGLLTQYLNVGDVLHAYVRKNLSFHLNKNKSPLILIGNGSGIAGLLAHLHQREQWGAGQNWLIYGERQKQFDSVYEDQLQHWMLNQTLSDLDLAFSRDHTALKYVQDALVAKQNQLKDWLEQGASIYVCGSLNGMAQGVEQVLITILGQDYLAKLKLQQRYKRDVY